MRETVKRILSTICYTSSYDNLQYPYLLIKRGGSDESVQEMLQDDPEALALFNELFKEIEEQ